MPNAIFNIDGNQIEVVPHPMFDDFIPVVVMPPFETIDRFPVYIRISEEFYDEILRRDRKDKELISGTERFNILHCKETEDFFENEYTILIQRMSIDPIGPPSLITDLRLRSNGYWAGVRILDQFNKYCT